MSAWQAKGRGLGLGLPAERVAALGRFALIASASRSPDRLVWSLPSSSPPLSLPPQPSLLKPSSCSRAQPKQLTSDQRARRAGTGDNVRGPAQSSEREKLSDVLGKRICESIVHNQRATNERGGRGRQTAFEGPHKVLRWRSSATSSARRMCESVALGLNRQPGV